MSKRIRRRRRRIRKRKSPSPRPRRGERKLGKRRESSLFLK